MWKGGDAMAEHNPYPAPIPPTPAELFRLLWEELTDILGSAAAAILLRRSHLAAARPPAVASSEAQPSGAGAEQLAITGTPVERVGLLKRVSSLVTHDTAALGLASAFALQHLRALEPHQARVREIERHSKSRHAIRREELLRQSHMRASDDIARGKLAMQACDAPRHQCVLELHRQVA